MLRTCARVMTTWWSKNVSQLKKKSHSQSPIGEQQHEEVSLSFCHLLLLLLNLNEWIWLSGTRRLAWSCPPSTIYAKLQRKPPTEWWTKRAPGQRAKPQTAVSQPRETKTEAIFNAITQSLMITNSTKWCSSILTIQTLHPPAFLHVFTKF